MLEVWCFTSRKSRLHTLAQFANIVTLCRLLATPTNAIVVASACYRSCTCDEKKSPPTLLGFSSAVRRIELGMPNKQFSLLLSCRFPSDEVRFPFLHDTRSAFRYLRFAAFNHSAMVFEYQGNTKSNISPVLVPHSHCLINSPSPSSFLRTHNPDPSRAIVHPSAYFPRNVEASADEHVEQVMSNIAPGLHERK